MIPSTDLPFNNNEPPAIGALGFRRGTTCVAPSVDLEDPQDALLLDRLVDACVEGYLQEESCGS